MAARYDILLQGSSVKLKTGLLGLSTVTLIKTRNGPILVDVGGYNMKPALLAALDRRALSPRDIRVVVLTHLHFDHAHAIDLFPHAKIIVSREEWDYAAKPHEDDLFMPWGIREQLDKHALMVVSGEGDLAPGVVVFPAPGHTPGSIAIMIDDDDHGRVVIAGDTIKTAREAIEQRCNGEFDPLRRGSATIRHIVDVADRIVCGHHPELIRLPKGGYSWDGPAELPLVIR